MGNFPNLDYQTVFETLPGSFIVLTADLNISAISHNHIYGSFCSREEMKGMNFSAFLHSLPEGLCDSTEMTEAVNRVLTHRKTTVIASHKCNIKTTAGLQDRYVKITNTPSFDEAGHVLFIVQQVEDCTSQKKSEEKFLTLFEAVPDATLLINESGKIHAVNEQTEKLLGFSKADLAGQPVEIIIPEQFRHNHVQHRNEFVKTGNARSMSKLTNLWACKKDGSKLPVDISLFPINSSEGLMYSVSIRDISASKKVQKQLDFLSHQITQSDYAILVADTDLAIKAWNNGSEKLYGFTEQEAIGQYADELLRTSATKKQIHAVIKIIAKQSYWSGEVVRKTKAGKEIFVRISNTTIRDRHGVVTGYVSVSHDITDQKKLRSEVNYLANLVEQSMEAIISRGIDRKLLSWNKGAENIFGYTKKEAIGKTARELGIIKFSDEEMAELERAVNESGSWKAEKQHFRKDGTEFTASVTSSAVKNDNGEIESIVTIINDISARVQLEDMLRKNNELLEETVLQRTEQIVISEKKYRNIFENNPMPMWVMDMNNFRFLDVNKTAVINYGYSREEFLFMTAKDIRPQEELNAFTSFDHFDESSVHKGTWKHLKKDGTVIDVEIIAHVIFFEGRMAKLILANDITEKKLADEKLVAREGRFRALLENNFDMIAMLDDQLKVIYRSSSVERLTGWADGERLGRPALHTVHPYDKRNLEATLKEVIANPGMQQECRYRNLHKDGSYRWMEGVVNNMLQDEFVQALVLNFRDVTARVEADKKLAASEERFRHSFDHMLEGVQIIGFDWRYIYVNDAMARHGKYKKEELVGFTVMDKYPGIENTAIYRQYLRCFEERVHIHLENEFEFPDKTKGWFELSFQPVPEGIFILSVDITDRKKAEQAIIQSEENLKAIFDNASEGFLLLDKYGTVKAFNNKVFDSAFLSIHEKLQIGKSIYNFVEGDRKDFFKLVFERVISGETIEYDRQYTLSNGDKNWIHFVFNPVKSEAAINGICISGYDITKEKIATQEKEFNSNNLNALINNTKDLMWSIDLNFRLITFNQAFAQMIKQMTGKQIMKGSDLLEDDFSNEQLQRFKKYFSRAFDGETFSVLEYAEAPFEIWSEISFNPIYEAGKVVGTACFSHDITNRKQAEEKLNKSLAEQQAQALRMFAILNTLPANIALLNENGLIVETNMAWDNFARENGYLGGGYGLGSNYISISEKASGKDKPDGKAVANGIRQVMNAILPEFVYEYSCNSPEVKRWFRMVVTPLVNKKNKGAVVMHIDISELRRLEEERLTNKITEQKKITLAMLHAQEQERNYIGRELHDNVNQILAGSKLFLELAGNKSTIVKDLIKYPVELIDKSIEEVRSLSKKLVTPLKNINLRDLVHDLASGLNNSTSIKTDFTYDVTDEPASDDLKLNIYRIIQEQINNTTRYAEAKNLHILIQQRRRVLKIVVMGNGKGFDMGKKRKGIGISNMINRAESFGGTLNIKTAIGKGCQTTVTIPY